MSKKFTPEGWPINIGKKRKLQNPGDRVRHYQIKEEIRHAQKDNPNKVIYLQKIKYDNDLEELRLCYYLFSKTGKSDGKWTFGQYAPLLLAEDFKIIVDEARARSWI